MLRHEASVSSGNPPPFDARQLALLQAYGDLLHDWNRRFNLTAIRARDEINRVLIDESLRLLPAVDELMARRQSTDPVRMIDIGSGAGVPGLPLAIARPGIEVTLLDATRKKVGFLQHVIDTLELPNVLALHGRAEELARDLDHRCQYDLVTARAVATLPTLLELTLPFLIAGGTALLPKGAELGEELERAKQAASLLGGEIISSDLLTAGHHEIVTRLVIADKIISTPDHYPRRVGLPSREPLGRPVK